MFDFSQARQNMIEGQLRPNRVTDPALLAAIAELPREHFLPAPLKHIAYVDDDIPLGNGRFLIEPMVLCRMLQNAAIGPLERRRQRVEQPRQHERQRLERFDRPVEHVPLEKTGRRIGRHQPGRVLARRRLMQADARRSEPRVDVGARQTRDVPERPQSPAFERREQVEHGHRHRDRRAAWCRAAKLTARLRRPRRHSIVAR